MKNLKLRTPAGLNDLTPEMYARLRQVERRVEAVFESHGYAFISAPSLEYAAVFEGKGSVPASRRYMFPDRHGDMLSLRPDMTPATARIAATNPMLWQEGAPLRLCYIEKAFRNQIYLQGKTGEFTQAGAELMGVCSAEADAEVTALAVESLLAAGLKDFRVDIGQVDFLRGVLAESALNESVIECITRRMIERDYVAVEKIVAEASAVHAVSEGARVILSDLTRWMGGPEILEEAAVWAGHPVSKAALDHLACVYGFLCDQGLAQYVLFDLSMTGHFDYYTGLIFRGYAQGTGYAVADGGRYDNLLAAFGKPSPAVGFGIRLDGLLDALSDGENPLEKADTLLMYTPGGRAAALKTASYLRKQGIRIENSLLGEDIARNMAYAKKKSMGGILYFTDSLTVRLFDLKKGTETSVSAESLRKHTGVY